MTTTVAIFFALALSVSATAEDGVVPPEQDVVEPITFLETEVAAQTAAEVAENAALHEEATDFLKKAGANACKSLADSAEKAVVDNVKAQQAILDKIDNGANCPQEGQPAVKKMEQKLKEAKDAEKAAKKAYNDALKTNVNFGSHQFDDLTKGSCGVFYNSAAYKNAEKKVADAKKKKDQAAGTVTQATKSVESAKTAAKTAVRLCQCNTYKAHKAALKDATDKVVAANTKEWKKAANLKCVLAGKTGCTVPPLPKLKAVSAAKGVDESKCAKWYAGGPIPKGCDTGYESYAKSHSAVGTYGGWSTTYNSGGADTKGKSFKLIRLNAQTGFKQGDKASMDRYVNMCLRQGLYAIGCGAISNYDASKCPTSIAMPTGWSCNMMTNVKNIFGNQVVGLLTNIWPASQTLYAVLPNGGLGYPQPSQSFYPVCGKWV